MRITPIVAAAMACAAGLPAAAQVTAAFEDESNAWSYAGPTGPAFWAQMPQYPACGGPRQSPVNLPRGSLQAPVNVAVTYPAWSNGSIYNNGHTVVVTPTVTTGMLRLDNVPFALTELHVHVPAEHTVQGHRYEAEIHVVNHLRPNNQLAVALTTFIAAGEHNPGWDALIAALPGHEEQRNPISGAVNLVSLLSLGNLPAEWLYRYEGSLTTPPCSPAVTFLIRQAPIVLSREQIDALSSAMVRNARPLQPGQPVQLHRGSP
jgi:carbonic anhydrase